MGVVYFNNVSSESLGIQVEHPPGYSFPEKDYEVTHIPGRNGDLYVDNHSWQNVTREYELSIGDEDVPFYILANRIAKWLTSVSGYARLEDTYEPDYFRYAAFKDGGDIENILQHGGRLSVSFNCKPQRYLKIGENPVNISESFTLYNPTPYTSLPLIIVHGSSSGSITIGDYMIDISSITDGMIIDSELQDVYLDDTNLNPVVTLSNAFPKLISGSNLIIFNGGITSVEVIPRWWTL